MDDWDGSRPLLTAPATFQFLTGEDSANNNKSGYLTLHSQARALQVKREAYARDAEDLARIPLPDARYLRPPSEVVLCHHPCFVNCPHRVLLSRAISAGYEFRAFPVRRDAVACATRAALEFLRGSVSEPQNHWFSIVEYDCAIYLYADFEEEEESSRTTTTTSSEAEFFDRCRLGLGFALRCIESVYGVDAERFGADRTYWLSACTSSKRSFHAHCKLAFASIDGLSAAMQFVRKALDALPPGHPTAAALRSRSAPPSAANPWILDFGVYTKHRNFRMAFQRKHGKSEGELRPFDHERRRRFEIDPADETDVRRWIKRSMIVLSNERRARAPAALPTPRAGELLLDLLRQYERNKAPREAVAAALEKSCAVFGVSVGPLGDDCPAGPARRVLRAIQWRRSPTADELRRALSLAREPPPYEPKHAFASEFWERVGRYVGPPYFGALFPDKDSATTTLQPAKRPLEAQPAAAATAVLRPKMERVGRWLLSLDPRVADLNVSWALPAAAAAASASARK